MLEKFSVLIKEFKRENRISFDPCVNAMGRWPYCLSRMEVSYCTFGLIWRDHSVAQSAHIIVTA